MVENTIVLVEIGLLFILALGIINIIAMVAWLVIDVIPYWYRKVRWITRDHKGGHTGK